MRVTRLSRLLAMTLCVGGVAACGKKKTTASTSAASAPTSPFLTQADVTAGANVNAPQQSDMVTALDSNADFYNNEPKSTSPCDSVLGAIVLSASASTLTLSGEVDVGACLAQAFAAGGSGATVANSSGSAKIYGVITCTGGDLSSFNGKTFADVENGAHPEFQCASGTVLLETEMSFSGNVTDSGQTMAYALKDIDFEGNAALAACPFTTANSKETTDNSCISVTKDDETETPTGGLAGTTEDFTKDTFSGVTDDTNSTTVWHDSGTISVTYDNWTGTVTFTNGATAPTYSMAQAGGTPATGSLTASSLALRQTIKAVAHRIKLL